MNTQVPFVYITVSIQCSYDLIEWLRADGYSILKQEYHELSQKIVIQIDKVFYPEKLLEYLMTWQEENPESMLDFFTSVGQFAPSLDGLQQLVPFTQQNHQNFTDMVIHYLKQYCAVHEKGIPPVGFYDRIIEATEKPLLEFTLAMTEGNKVQAAKILGINRNTLAARMKKLGLE